MAGAPERARPSSEPVTVEVWIDPPNEEFAKYWEGTLLPRFKQQYSQTKVELTWSGWTELEAKLTSGHANQKVIGLRSRRRRNSSLGPK